MKKKSKNKIPFIRLADKDNVKITQVKLPDDVLELFGFNDVKEDYGTFLSKYLTKPKYNELFIQFQKYVHDSMPDEVKAKCEYCALGTSTDSIDKICNGYIMEAKGNFFFAGNEFYRIYCQNKKLFKDEKQIRYLCYIFFSCFKFQKGLVYFDIDNLLDECLKEGLKSISDLLEKSDTFRKMKIINHSLYDLKKQQINHQIEHKYKNEYIQFQIKHYKEAKRFYTEEEEIKAKYKTDNNILQKIWLADAKLSIDDFLQKGIDTGIWNQQYEIITKKGSLYGTGKSLLGNLSYVLKGYCISQETDYKVIGEVFCTQFQIEIKENTKQPYKAFNSINRKYTAQLKRAFSIK